MTFYILYSDVDLNLNQPNMIKCNADVNAMDDDVNVDAGGGEVNAVINVDVNAELKLTVEMPK